MARLEPRPGVPRGYALLHDPLLNKGSAFPAEEREALGLRGLLPPHVFTMEEQLQRVMQNYARKDSELERYIFLVSLQDRNETLFHRVLVDHLDALLPIVYTPTVGEACQHFAEIFRRPRGVYVTLEDRGRIREVLRNVPRDDVRVVVLTDGEPILGLGDQGASGMGIPIGKLALYTACAGIAPARTLPVLLDVGTDNAAYRDDPLYLGLRRPRLRGDAYDAIFGELVDAMTARWPRALVQLEDFGNANAFRLLARWRDRICTFDDDIQGTAAVALAGLLSALRLTGKRLRDQRVLFLGAGEAGIGIGDLVATAVEEDGASAELARRACWFFDSRGLVVRGREHLTPEKERYAHEHPPVRDFADAVRALRPTAIIGVAAIRGAFGPDVLQAMAQLNDRPIVFALSNPTSRSECTAEEAYRATDGRAIFASGSPFAPVEWKGERLVPGQGNNSYVFPGVGLGVVVAEARHVTERMFSAAARALAASITDDDLAMGRVYPALSRIREVSARVAAAVAEIAHSDGLARAPRPPDLLEHVRASMWEPRYESLLSQAPG